MARRIFVNIYRTDAALCSVRFFFVKREIANETEKRHSKWENIQADKFKISIYYLDKGGDRC